MTRIKLFVTSVLTLTGKKKRYALGDMAYGEFLIYKDGYPKYYLYVLDIPDIKEKIKGGSVSDLLKSRLPLIEKGLTLHHGVNGLLLRELEPELLELKEFPYLTELFF